MVLVTAKVATSMMLMVPAGLLPAETGSASFATRMRLPSGVKVSMSGRTPTSTVVCSTPAALNSATCPASPGVALP